MGIEREGQRVRGREPEARIVEERLLVHGKRRPRLIQVAGGPNDLVEEGLVLPHGGGIVEHGVPAVTADEPHVEAGRDRR